MPNRAYNRPRRADAGSIPEKAGEGSRAEIPSRHRKRDDGARQLFDLDALERTLLEPPSWIGDSFRPALALIRRVRTAEAHEKMTNDILIQREAEWVNAEAHFRHRIAQLERIRVAAAYFRHPHSSEAYYRDAHRKLDVALADLGDI